MAFGIGRGGRNMRRFITRHEPRTSQTLHRAARFERLEGRQLLAQVMAYGFEEVSGNVLDAALGDGAQDGTLTNGATRTSPGLVGSQALSLDGTNDVLLIGPVASTGGVSGISLAVWIDPNTLNGTINLQTALAITRNGNAQQDRADVSIDGTGAIRGGGRKLDADTFRSVISASNVITAAEAGGATWIHIGAVFNYVANTITLYKNGVQVGGGSAAWGAGTTTSNTPAQGCAIGSNRTDGTANEQFAGRIDDAQVYNTALSGAEMLAIYNSGAIAFPTA